MTSRRLELRDVCLASLERFYVPETGMLSRAVSWDGQAWTRGAPSAGNTAGAAMALYGARKLGWPVPLDPDALLDVVVARHVASARCEELAMMLWADAVGSRRHMARLQGALCRKLNERAPDTLTLAWSLGALCHCLRNGAGKAATRRVVERLAAAIGGTQSARTGLFRSSNRRTGLWRRRNPVATLAAQTYTMHALVLYGTTCDRDEPVARALRCADTLCGLQGPKGQWWWRYDVRDGTVPDPYPVYSVNQDSAIPLGFESLQRIQGDRRYARHVEGGLDWLFGDNELQQSLVDQERHVIWRGIERHGAGLRVMAEMRSYHPSRYLYALSLSEIEGGPPGRQSS